MTTPRLLSSSICLVLALALPLVGAPVTAQDESSTDEGLEPGDIASTIPDAVAGNPVQAVVRRGEENFTMAAFGEGQDPPDEEEIASIEEMLDAVGATIDDLTTVIWGASDDEDFAFVFGFQIEGVSEAVLEDTLVAMLEQDMASPQREPAELGGKQVLLIREAGEEDADSINVSQLEGVDGTYVYIAGDDLWAILGSGELVDEILMLLPAGE